MGKMTKEKNENPCRRIRIEKVTLNIGAGRDVNKLENGMILLERITGRKPIKTITKKRIPSWDLRPGLPIGCKVTLRGKYAEEILKKLLKAVGNKLKEKSFDNLGNISFGIAEYIDIPGMKYDPKIGILGLDVCITLERIGYRIRRRKYLRRKINKRIAISKEEAIQFMKNKFNVEIE